MCVTFIVADDKIVLKFELPQPHESTLLTVNRVFTINIGYFGGGSL